MTIPQTKAGEGSRLSISATTFVPNRHTDSTRSFTRCGLNFKEREIPSCDANSHTSSAERHTSSTTAFEKDMSFAKEGTDVKLVRFFKNPDISRRTPCTLIMGANSLKSVVAYFESCRSANVCEIKSKNWRTESMASGDAESSLSTNFTRSKALCSEVALCAPPAFTKAAKSNK